MKRGIPDSVIQDIAKHRPRAGLYFGMRKLKRQRRDIEVCIGQMRSAMNRRNYAEAERYLSSAEKVIRGK